MTSDGRARSGFRVLLYHKVDSRFEWGGTWVTPSQFKSHVLYLLDRGYRFVTLEELLRPEGGSDWSAALTFDDGYLALKDFALPFLRDLGIPASVFVVTGFVGRENLWDVNVGWRRFDHMDWADIEEAAAHGVRFYSHTHSHRDLTGLDPREVREELTLSKETLERRLGGIVPYLSYPFGIYNAAVARQAKESGYEAAFTLFRNGAGDVDPLYSIERAAVYRIDTPGSLRRKLEGGVGGRVERAKCRAINWCARGTPVAKRLLGRIRDERRQRGKAREGGLGAEDDPRAGATPSPASP
ncbi:MAG: polysaccharide deacetylase family protein [Candidatus Eisenbacteria bacterium]|nr:polysaccharide deacetylase family protein [Candidatus Eisenbacteria bacterium]